VRFIKNKKLLGGAAITAAIVIGVSVKSLLFPGDRIEFSDGAELAAYFDAQDYRLASVAAGEIDVPRLLLAGIPEGWGLENDVERRKRVFFRATLPLVLEANALVARDRARVLYLRPRIENRQPIHGSELEWLRQLARKYEIKNWRDVSDPKVLDELELRVDVVPVSLGLVQAAVESGYGTSRFAREGNALFGQWTWGEGLTPEKQRDGKGDYKIAAFETPLHSVKSYILNLNTHTAYKGFRARRAELRSEGKDVLNGTELLPELSAYSEKGQAYLDILAEAIEVNKLSGLDGAKLAENDPKSLVPNP